MTNKGIHPFDPSLLHSVEGLELLAKELLSGIQSGIHPNLLKGSGQEFSQYRNYQPGDDLRQVDWKMYARSDRFYVRESELESQVSVQFVLDTSASMLHEEGGISKLDYAKALGTALAYLVAGQGDEVQAFGVQKDHIFQAELQRGRASLSAFWLALSQWKGAGKWPFFEQIRQWPYQAGRKTLSVLFSDFYEQEGEITSHVKFLRSMGNEVVVFQLMGAREYAFDFGKNTRFRDLESGKEVQVDSRKARKKYEEQRDAFLEETRKKLLELGVPCVFVRMNEKPGDVLKGFLQSRKYSLR